MNDKEKLLPCPFCGAAVEESRDCAGIYNYFCTVCECALLGDYTHHATGRKAWNTRATATAQSEASEERDDKLRIVEELLNIANESLRLSDECLGLVATQRNTAMEALERLARLGNAGYYGNSDGNMIAQQALSAVKKMQLPSALQSTKGESDE